MNKQEFLSLIVPLAQSEAKRRKDAGTGFVLPSVCIGQAALETGWGGSSLMTKANAFFGIKATASWGGKVFNSKTHECYDSVNYTTITAAFRAYNTPADSVKDYYDLITGSTRYAAAVNVTDARTAITAIKEGDYATSPTYVTDVMAVIDSNNLTQYDNVVTGNAEPRPAESKSAEELAQEIINGAWGSNPERRKNITAKYGAAAYEAAQARVNEIMGAATIKSKTAEELADEIIKGKWGSNPERRENIIAKYGAAAYKAAQAIVNKRMG
jgi:hypothetical protein